MPFLQNLSLPNKLSFSRIVIIPLLVAFLSWDNRWMSIAATVLFIAASITDLVDGYLARKYNTISQMGKFLDPLADKLMIFAVLIMLLYLDRVHFLYVIVLIGRDVAVNSLRGIATEEGVVIAASKFGKYKTATQVIALIGLILGQENQLFGVNWYAIGQFFLIVATAFSLISAYQYFSAYRIGSHHDR